MTSNATIRTLHIADPEVMKEAWGYPEQNRDGAEHVVNYCINGDCRFAWIERRIRMANHCPRCGGDVWHESVVETAERALGMRWVTRQGVRSDEDAHGGR